MEADPTLGEQIAVFEENEPESNNESQSPKIKVG